jgi:hypothetical protein
LFDLAIESDLLRLGYREQLWSSYEILLDFSFGGFEGGLLLGETSGEIGAEVSEDL